MLVTINTDAYFSSKFGIGAFAFWIRSNEFLFQNAGLLKQKTKNPTEAEIKTILNDLYTTLKHVSRFRISHIIFNTDSLNSMHILRNDKPNIKKYCLKWGKCFRVKFHALINEYNKCFPGYYLTYEFRHVKAHTNNEDKRSYVNNWCDARAKKFLRTAVRLREN